MKFKVGDKVRVVRAILNHKSKHIGDVFTIGMINPKGFGAYSETHYSVEETSCMYIWLESELELVENSKIVITHDGKTTAATLYRDGEKVKATAKCAPEDKFDFMVGAKMAMERLVAKTTEPPKPKYYNGKVVCVANDCAGYVDTDFTPGKVYEVVDGKFIDNNNTFRPTCDDFIVTLADLNNTYFSDWFYKFIPYVE